MLGSIQETLAPKAEGKQDPEVKDFRYPPLQYIHTLSNLQPPMSTEAIFSRPREGRLIDAKFLRSLKEASPLKTFHTYRASAAEAAAEAKAYMSGSGTEKTNESK